MKKYIRDYSGLLVFAGFIVALDQWTKALVRANLSFTESWSPWPWLEPYARILFWKNTGAAFGILQGFGNVFMVLAVIVSLVIIYYYPRVPRQEWVLRLAMGMQLAGALGNLIDRVMYGYVLDFISVGNFAIFNVADASISVGVVVLLVAIWWKERNGELAAPDSDQPAESVTEELASHDPSIK